MKSPIGLIVFFLLGGGFIFFPGLVLCASGMSDWEDEPFFVWSVRLLGIVFVGIGVWALAAGMRH